MKIYLAAVIIALSVFVLERARDGVVITQSTVGQTPVTHYAQPGANGPAVVIAHGFAGSEQMMQGYALPLAQAGYRVFVFEFLGHGRNLVPMSGDVTAVDGTTRLLVGQTQAVIDAVSGGDRPVALLGHSMATDILVRVAHGRSDVGPMVLISAFSDQVDASFPRDLLLISGAAEPRLRAFALRSVQMLDPAAAAGEVVAAPDVIRRAFVAPMSDHVSVLQSRAGRQAAVAWINRAYGRDVQPRVWPTGWAILGLLAGLVVIFRAFCAALPPRDIITRGLSAWQTSVVLAVPMLAAPLVAVPLDVQLLPVLVADYLGVHMLVYGGAQLLLLRAWGIKVGPLAWPALGVLLLGCAAFGFALDRYAANFWPTGVRLWIITALCIGAVAYMLADSILTTPQTWGARLCTRGAFLISLGIAVALDFEALFFLMLIAPVLILFYLVFGSMGRAAALRAGPLSAGLALGCALAWSLGVSFPLFQS